MDQNREKIWLEKRSMTIITQKLNYLCQRIEDQGYPLNDDLNPGLDRWDILALTKFFPGDLPEELIELYQWRNGQIHGEWQESADYGLSLFRDNYFIPLYLAEEYYQTIQQYYIHDKSQAFLRLVFPFAAFEGSTWVICCGEQPLKPELKHPIVSVFEGIEVFFFDLSSMLDTIVAWYQEGAYRIKQKRSGTYTPLLDMDVNLERQIWERINPGVFS